MEDEDTACVEPAILVRGLSKQYSNDPKVLNELDMTVIKGSIYSLLGASGCGKTTLLGAILGSRKIQKGSISILGKQPGVVPTKSIGYMPQDIALITEFTIKHMLRHQGWIFGMTDAQIEERHKFYEKLLDLPPANKLIKNLSGGQQRRVSLAVVFMHNPELLILDEPTVGLDPVLRQNLWDYLIKITKEEKKTVVITTHYIEEARQADMVGMLRNGKMLIEGEPQTLMNQFNYSTLEDLFVSLCLKQEERDPNISDPQQPSRLISKSDELKIFNQRPSKESILKKICFTDRGHAKALLTKNFMRYVGSPGTFLMVLIIPIIQVFAVFSAVGKIPTDMTIGVVNQELGEYRNCIDYFNDNNTAGGNRVDEFGTCVYEGLGCKFIEQVQNVIPNQIYFESTEEGLKAVRKGEIHQLLFFPRNYSEAFTIVSNFNDISPEEANYSQILFYRDEVDNPLSVHITMEIYNWYLRFAGELADDCGWRKGSAKIPIVFNEPIYGSVNITYGDMVAPGTLALTLKTLAEALAIDTIINERRGGVWERTIISGVKPAEILIFHIITFTFTSAIQTLESFLLALYVFGLECKGSLLEAFFLLYLQALIGVATGLSLSVFTNSEAAAVFTSLGIALPLLVLSGYSWPVEGMPVYLRYFTYFLPTTIPLESFYNIIFRGWDISNFNVYKGYLISIGHICLSSIICIFGLKFEKK